MSALLRKTHYWGSIFVLVPILLVIVTGILLQIRKEWSWVQPTEQKGSKKVPSITFEQVLAAVSGVPEAQVSSWADIARVDARIGKGITKVTAKNGYEIQLDSATGEVLQVAYRRSDVITALHEGSWFADWVRFYVFLPVAFVLFGLALTGAYLFFLPLVVKWRRAKTAS